MARTLEQLDAALTAIENELGPVVDPGAQTIRKRIREIGVSQNGIVARMDGIPGGTTVTAYVDAKIAAIPKPPSGSVDAASVRAALASYGVHIEKDPANGRLYVSLGAPPRFDTWAPFQIRGGLAGWIFAEGSTQNVPGQGSGAPDSATTLKILDGDGGFRVLQYGTHGKNGFVRNTLARRFSVFAMDSIGEFCGEVCEPEGTPGAIPPGAKPENGGGQTWYMKFDFVNKLVRLLPFKPEWAISIERCSTTYADADKKVEPV